MKIETQPLEDQQTRLIAELDSETLERYRRQAARRIAQKTKFPGFRPGKAPYEMVRRVYGEEALTQEAIELLLDEVYPKILQEANITPSGPGKLDEIIQMDPPKFAFVVPLPPSIELGDYQEIRRDYAPEAVTEEQIEQTVRRLQRSFGTAEPVERPAEQGDLVSFKMSAVHTQPEEGEDAALLEETPYQMVAGEEEGERDESWPYEGFTQELVGLGANDTKTVHYTFTEESPFEDLRGKETDFIITVQNVKSLTLPELTDEFAQSLGEFENVAALRDAIRKQLEQQYSQQYDQDYFDQLTQDLVSRATIKYPPHMLEEEIEQFLHGVEHNLEHDRLDLETYLKMREMDRESFIEAEVKPAATRRLERSLVMEEFARKEGIEVKSEEIRYVYNAALQQMQQSAEMRKQQTKNKQSAREMANNLAISTVNNIFNQRIISRLKAIATGKGDEPAEDLSLFPDLSLLSAAGEEAEPVENSAAAEVTAFEGMTEEDILAEAEEAAGEPEAVVDPVEEQIAAEYLPVSDETANSSSQTEEDSSQADEDSESQEA